MPIYLPLPKAKLLREIRIENNVVPNTSVLGVVKNPFPGFPGGAVVENLPANAGDTGSSPGLGRSHMPRSNWTREPQ